MSELEAIGSAELLEWTTDYLRRHPDALAREVWAVVTAERAPTIKRSTFGCVVMVRARKTLGINGWALCGGKAGAPSGAP